MRTIPPFASAVVALALLVGCGPGVSNDPSAIVSPLALEPPPILSLIGYREEIGLTSDQIAELDSLALAVRDRNRPLMEELREYASDSRSRYRGAIVVDERSRPLIDRARRNNREAAEAVESLLSAEQAEAVCRVVRRDDPPRERPRRERRDTTALPPAGWPWCGAP